MVNYEVPGEIQWPIQTKTKKPHLKFIKALNSVEPSVVNSRKSSYIPNSNNKTSWFSWICTKICFCCYLAIPGLLCRKNQVLRLELKNFLFLYRTTEGYYCQ